MLRESPLWAEFVERLANESLAGLAAEYGQTEQALWDDLVASSTGQAVTEELWWPEAIRQLADGVSVREISRRFQTSPRRLRRGFARASVRVGGAQIDQSGLEVLAPFRDRLGEEPDSAIAAEAKVTVEAVQGERRRLGIDPYTRTLPPSAPPPPEPDDSWLAPPPPKKKEKRVRPWRDPEAKEPTIIRRPSSRRVTSAMTSRFAATPPAGTTPDSSETEGDEDLSEDDEQRRVRRGRLRIVRPGEDRQDEDSRDSSGDDEPTSLRRSNRRRNVSPHGEVKVLTPESVDIPDVIQRLPTLPPRRPRAVEPPRPGPAQPSAQRVPPPLAMPAPSADGHLTRRVSVRPAVTSPPVEADAPQPAPQPAPQSVYETPPATVDAAAKVAPSPTARKPRTRPATMRPPSDGPPTQSAQPPTQSTQAPAPPPPVAAAPAAAAPVEARSRPRFGWHVRVGGRTEPLLVVASDVAEAARIASEAVASRDLADADITLYLPELVIG